MQLKKYKQRLTTIAAILLATILLTACSDSDSDSDSAGSDSGSNDQNNRPLIEKDFKFEEELREIISDGAEEHVFEIEVDKPVILNVIADPKVYGWYGKEGSVWPTYESMYFDFLDHDFNILGSLKKNAPYKNYNINQEFKINETGTYYIVAGLPVRSGEDKYFMGFNSHSNKNEYFLTVQKQQIKDIITGTNGNDIIRGSNKDQSIFGKAGDDILYGTGGKNHIDGGDGNDTIYSSEGKDALTGGAGRDKFVYTSISHSPANELDRDELADFNSDEDFIDLSSLPTFKETSLHTDSIPTDSECTRSTNPSNAAKLWLENSILYGRYEVSGCGTKNANFSISLPGVTGLSSKNFIFSQ